MRTMPPSSNTIEVARESLRMDKDTGERTFRIMAMIMMGVTALGTALHAGHTFWRDCFGGRERREHRRGEGRSYGPPEEPEYNHSARDETPSQRDEPDRERSWSRREERRGRSPEGEEGWTEHRRQTGHGRER